MDDEGLSEGVLQASTQKENLPVVSLYTDCWDMVFRLDTQDPFSNIGKSSPKKVCPDELLAFPVHL